MKTFILSLTLLALASSCGDNEDPSTSDCGQDVIINTDLYSTAPTDMLDIMEINIVNDCLELSFGSSGCDGESWEVRLIDSGEILESFPEQRNLILSLKNDEECDAYFTRSYSFDISDLQIGGEEIILNITNTNSQISYKH